MKRILSIEGIEKKWDKQGKEYWVTHATLEDGTEVRGYGPDFEAGDRVEYFFDPVYDVAKMQKTKPKK